MTNTHNSCQGWEEVVEMNHQGEEMGFFFLGGGAACMGEEIFLAEYFLFL